MTDHHASRDPQQGSDMAVKADEPANLSGKVPAESSPEETASSRPTALRPRGVGNKAETTPSEKAASAPIPSLVKTPKADHVKPDEKGPSDRVPTELGNNITASGSAVVAAASDGAELTRNIIEDASKEAYHVTPSGTESQPPELSDTLACEVVEVVVSEQWFSTFSKFHPINFQEVVRVVGNHPEKYPNLYERLYGAKAPESVLGRILMKVLGKQEKATVRYAGHNLCIRRKRNHTPALYAVEKLARG